MGGEPPGLVAGVRWRPYHRRVIRSAVENLGSRPEPTVNGAR
jgi:hypothetical protein